MARLPAEPQRGRPVSSSWGRDVARYLRYLTPSGGAGIRVDKTGPNIRLSRARERRQAGTPAETFPFQIVKSADDKVRIRYGTVNGEVPEIGGTELDPTLEDGPELSIATGSDGTRAVYLRVVLDALLEMDTLDFPEGSSVPANTSTTGHYRIGTVWVEDGRIVQVENIVKSNLAYAYGGSTSHVFIGVA